MGKTEALKNLDLVLSVGIMIDYIYVPNSPNNLIFDGYKTTRMSTLFSIFLFEPNINISINLKTIKKFAYFGNSTTFHTNKQNNLD